VVKMRSLNMFLLIFYLIAFAGLIGIAAAQGDSFDTAEEIEGGVEYTYTVPAGGAHYFKIYLNTGDSIDVYSDFGSDNPLADGWELAFGYYDPNQNSIEWDDYENYDTYAVVHLPPAQQSGYHYLVFFNLWDYDVTYWFRVEGAGDEEPVVTITFPVDGAEYYTSEDSITITIEAEASDDQGVDRVEFYVDGSLIGTDYSEPYTASATVGIGNHTILAKAFDTAGQFDMDSVEIRVRPELTLEYPPVTWTETGSKTKLVHFQEGTTYVLTADDQYTHYGIHIFAPSNPYYDDVDHSWSTSDLRDYDDWTFPVEQQASYTAPSTGDYKIIIKMYSGNEDLTWTLSVEEDSGVDTVDITDPEDGSTFYTTDTIDVHVHAYDASGIAKVEVYIDGNYEGDASHLSGDYYIYSTQITTVGSHTITAKAYDNDGNYGTDTITVNIVEQGTEPTPEPEPGSITVEVDEQAMDGVKFYIGEHTIKVRSASGTIEADIYINGDYVGRTSKPWWNPFADYELKYDFSAGDYTILATAEDASDTINITVLNMVDPDDPDAIVIVALRESTWSFMISNFTVKRGEKVVFEVCKQDAVNSMWDWKRISGAQVYINDQPVGITAKTDFGSVGGIIGTIFSLLGFSGFGGRVGYVHTFEEPRTYEVYAITDEGTTQTLYITVSEEEYNNPIGSSPLGQFFQNIARAVPLTNTILWALIIVFGGLILIKLAIEILF